MNRRLDATTILVRDGETAYVGRRTEGSTNSSSGINVNAASVDRLCGTARWKRVTAMLKVSPCADSTVQDTPIRSRPSIVVGREQRDGSNTHGHATNAPSKTCPPTKASIDRDAEPSNIMRDRGNTCLQLSKFRSMFHRTRQDTSKTQAIVV